MDIIPSHAFAKPKKNCPLSGQCCTEAVVYQTTVTNNNSTAVETYVGLTQNQFKYRYNKLTDSFKNPVNKTPLS